MVALTSMSLASPERMSKSSNDGPGNQKFPDFKPLSENEFAKYTFVESTLPEHRRQLWVNFENAFNYSAPKPVSEASINYERESLSNLQTYQYSLHPLPKENPFYERTL